MRSTASTSRKFQDERGNAIASHVMVQALVVFVFLALMQLAYALYVRNTVLDIASQSARRGALIGGSDAEAAARARQLLAQYLSPSYPATVTVHRQPMQLGDGHGQLITVSVTAQLPVLGPLGPRAGINVSGRALGGAP